MIILEMHDDGLPARVEILGVEYVRPPVPMTGDLAPSTAGISALAEMNPNPPVNP